MDVPQVHRHARRLRTVRSARPLPAAPGPHTGAPSGVLFDKGQASPLKFTERMKQAIDTPRGRKLYGQRMGTVEPVFGNLRHNKRLNRFTLRGQRKVNTQWQLYCLVHNIERLSSTTMGMRSKGRGALSLAGQQAASRL